MQIPDFRLLAFLNGERIHLFALSHPVCGNLLKQQQETNTRHSYVLFLWSKLTSIAICLILPTPTCSMFKFPIAQRGLCILLHNTHHSLLELHMDRCLLLPACACEGWRPGSLLPKPSRRRSSVTDK